MLHQWVEFVPYVDQQNLHFPKSKKYYVPLTAVNDLDAGHYPYEGTTGIHYKNTGAGNWDVDKSKGLY